MSFFGLENNDLEEEKRRFLQGGLREEEDIAVYNWGADDYDGLGNALQEGNDELNDETFGGAGPIGKDFDFAAHTLPGTSSEGQRHHEPTPVVEAAKPSQSARDTVKSRESIWDDKSPFSVLRTSGSIGRKAGTGLGHQQGSSSSSLAPRFTHETHQQTQSPSQSQQVPQSQSPGVGVGTINYAAPGVRTLQEIEAEMRAQTQRARALQAQRAQQAQQEQLLLQQQQQRQQEQQLAKPPRMRSQSPSVYPGGRVNSPSVTLQQQLFEQQDRMRLEELERQFREQSLLSQEFRQPDIRELYMLQQQQQPIHHRHEPSLPPRLDPTSQVHRYHTSTGTPFPTPDEVQLMLRQQMVQQQATLAALAESQSQGQLPTEILRRQSQSPMRAAQAQMRLVMANEMLERGQGTRPIPPGSVSHADIAQVQMQQRLLAQMAQQEFSHALGGLGPLNGQGGTVSGKNQEALKAEAMRKIMETEKQEGKRRRKAAKIAHMSRYNDLMTQSDKDFITRIQVSQLVTSDPYTEDFYAQVYGSLLRSRLGISASEERVLKFGSGEGVGLGLNQRGGNRRPNAMQRMEAQVERIVNNARQREKEKGLHAIHSLQGALGKTAGRSYKAAPRQLLQVDTNGAADPSAPHAHGHISKEDARENAAAAKEAAKRGREALGAHADLNGVVKDPLTRIETLVILERLYDILLHVEQLRREQPSPDDEQATQQWTLAYASEVQKLWDGLQIMVPLETSDPHPFISLLMPSKGKRLLPRLSRHLSSQQLLTMLTLLVACFTQVDVVQGATLLDEEEGFPGRDTVDKETQVFLSTVLQNILPIIASASLRLIGGLLGLLLERCDMQAVVRSRPGLALLTAFLSRVEVIKSDLMSGTNDQAEIPSEEESLQWQNIYDHLFHTLAPHLLFIFPSTRISSLKNQAGVTTTDADLLDQLVWKFLATLSLQASNEQQQILVSSLREKIMDNVLAVGKGYVTDENEQSLKITNVNIFLHALGLDSSQINL